VRHQSGTISESCFPESAFWARVDRCWCSSSNAKARSSRSVVERSLPVAIASAHPSVTPIAAFLMLRRRRRALTVQDSAFHLTL
jgi:hypothetical protein